MPRIHKTTPSLEYETQEPRPKYPVDALPARISDLSATEMRDMHGRMIGWIAFRLSQKSEITKRLMDAQDALESIRAEIQKRNPTLEQWRLKEVCRRDPKWSEMNNDCLSAEKIIVSLECEIEKLEKVAAVLSREQSFRESEMRATI